jgi:hypothetical protein
MRREPKLDDQSPVAKNGFIFAENRVRELRLE